MTLGEGERVITVQLTVLGSGSGGNATLLATDEGRVLIDAGLSCREVTRRLGAVGVEPDGVDAIVITHAHGDHTRGARVFSRRHGVPVYTTAAVRDEWGVKDVSEWRMLEAGRAERISGLAWHPFTIPHDASETVGFRIETAEGVIGFATDVGTATENLIQCFRDCRLLVVESNHATELLRVSPYAPSTRTRIAGAHGHLSNEALAAFVRQHLGPSVRCIVLAHLSRVNNVPEIAEMTCRQALADCGRTDVEVVVARQDRVAPTVDLGAWHVAPPAPPAARARQSALPF